VRYPLVYDHGWQVDFHSLAGGGGHATRGVIVVNPNNPTGHFVKANELQALNDICAERDLAIIADEVFLDSDLVARRADACNQRSGSDVCDERKLSESCRVAADEMAWLVANGPRH